MTDPDFLFLPHAGKFISLSQISSVEPDFPREIKYEFPELISKRKRPKTTKWACTVRMAGGEYYYLRNVEAENFLRYLQKRTELLIVPDPIKEEEDEK